MVLGLSLGFIGKAWYGRVKRERAIEAEKQADWDYREKFRNSINRIRQNLKLDHFLAAYKSLETLPTPPEDDPTAKEEYAEVLNRIGRGLLENELLKESEEVFLTLREFEGNRDLANKAMSEIESKRHIESAELHYAQGQRLFEDKKYQDAYGEFQKADVDINSVESLKFDDIRAQKEKNIAALRAVKYYLYLDKARVHIKETELLFKKKAYDKVQGELGKAAGSLGRAAFLHNNTPEVLEIRQRLEELDVELGYQLPNALPIYNRYTPEMLERVPQYFRLEGYEFDPNPDADNSIKVGLRFVRDNNEPFYIVRYRIYFVDNKDFFNGHFIMPEPNNTSSALEGHVVYKQEIPAKFKGIQVQRIEVSVFNADDIIVSRIVRAFRKVS